MSFPLAVSNLAVAVHYTDLMAHLVSALVAGDGAQLYRVPLIVGAVSLRCSLLPICRE